MITPKLTAEMSLLVCSNGRYVPKISSIVQGPRENSYWQEVQATSSHLHAGQHTFLDNCFSGHSGFPFAHGVAGDGAPKPMVPRPELDPVSVTGSSICFSLIGCLHSLSLIFMPLAINIG